MEEKHFSCPLCVSGHLEFHEVIKDPAKIQEDKSYFWICNECPAILLEWYDHSDTEAFKKYTQSKSYF